MWLIMAGRGFGKTWTGSGWSAEKARTYPGCRIALVAPTFSDGRDTMIEGVSGLLSMLAPSELKGGTQDKAWNRSLGQLELANGSRFQVYTSERPAKLRGSQHHFAWGDEPAHWKDAKAGTARDTTWTNLKIATRNPALPGWPDGYQSQICLTTTPKPVALLKSRNLSAPGLLQDPLTTVTTGSTYENLANLSETYRRTVVDPLEGTRLGRQELNAELLEDVEGALWTGSRIESARVPEHPELVRVVVAVDPSGGSRASNDEQGIVVAGKGTDGHAYVLADRSCRLSPDGWGWEAVKAYLTYSADRIIAETNYGGDMVEHTIRTVARDFGETVATKQITASRGKQQRAEPVAALYEQGQVHHVKTLPDLEDEMTTWTPDSGDSPNRMDALVWALTELMLTGQGLRFL